MNKTRYCLVKGHEENNITYLCTYKHCQLDSKWVCVDCIVNQIHDHGQLNQNHLMKQHQFLDFIKKQSQPSYLQKKMELKLIQICIKELQYLIQSTQFLMQRLEEDLIFIEKNNNLQEIEEIINITKQNYFLLENKQIEKILNINNYNKRYEYNLSQNVVRQIIKLHQDLSDLLKNNFKKYNDQIKQGVILDNQIIQPTTLDNQIIQPNTQLFYQRHFYYKQESRINTSRISYDEKYLVFGYGSKIQVYDIITKQFIKIIEIDNNVRICIFTKDSNNLLCGDSKGYLHCFDTKNNFNQLYKNQIHSSSIIDLLPIDNTQIITCSSDQTIRITNIKQKYQQFLIENAHKEAINTIEFDQQNNVIISGSSDKSIRFFNKTTGVMQFQKKDAHYISVYQIQLVSDQNNNLLSLGLKDLFLWYIDYNNKNLNKIRVFQQRIIENFTTLANNRIMLICRDEILFLDQNLSLILFVNHDFNIQYSYNMKKQINSINYIILQRFEQESEILVLKRT